MTVAITGITGNMGQAVFAALNGANLDRVKLLVRNVKRAKKLLKSNKTLSGKVTLIVGDMTDVDAIKQLVSGTDLVINMAAVIPPRSDQNPQAAVNCNQIGADILVSQIEKLGDDQPALIHISTVAVYGDRTAHPFGRVGDPLLPSPLDVYSVTKVRGEFRVLESDIKKWTVIRQSAMLHPQMLNDNVHDGLMFHTVFDAPLEWVTAHDSAILMRNIINGFCSNALPDNFWNRCFNLAGGKNNRRYGMQTFDDGFSVVGGNTSLFFKPGYNATRNFHGMWYLDCDELNDMFDYQSQTPDEYWRQIFKAHPLFKLGKIVPKRIIGHFVVGRLLKDKNSPAYWAANGDEARLIAYFGGRDNYEKLQKADWNSYPIKSGDGINDLTDNDTPVCYGYDITKPDSQITQDDVAAVARAHGGELLSPFDGDMYKKLDFVTQDGKKFTARAYTVMRAGHWHNPIYDRFVWDFDRLAKKDSIIASVWYGTHGRDENYIYTLDENFTAHAVKTE